ncbi:E3 ubiquitin-protein ligase SINA-like 2 [Raphanus sativus]|nr:E3 ubiquitin-protein ligase SINA-like 2 [Raphanus sativus]
MMKETNKEKGVAGEASSSSRRRKRRRLPSAAEYEGRVTGSVDEDEVIPESRSGTLLDLDLLDCPVCFQALTKHVFQVSFIVLIIERIVESVTVPCPNAKHGCTEKFSYGKESAHEKECGFSLCYCPAPNCSYAGVYKDLYRHYDANRKDTWNRFVCGFIQDSKIAVLQEYKDGSLVVLQCFELPQGMSVTVNRIAPSAPGVGKFSFSLTYSMGRHTVTFGSREMNRIQRVSFQTPEDDFIVRRSAREKKANSKYQNKIK